LNRQLSERWIGRGGGSTSWPPRSPDLTPLDFFLWGFVKDEVYVLPMPINLKNLKDRTRTATAKTDQPLLQNFWHEVEFVLMCAGQQMEQILNFRRKLKKKNFLSCSLQWCELSFCVAIIFSPINLCNRSHHLQSSCICHYRVLADSYKITFHEHQIVSLSTLNILNT